MINNPFRGCGGVLNAVLVPKLQLVQEPAADALLVGMLLGQQ